MITNEWSFRLIRIDMILFLILLKIHTKRLFKGMWNEKIDSHGRTG